MTITETKTISFNPSKDKEYKWWFDNKESLLEKGYILNDNGTQEWHLTLKQTTYINVGGR